MKPYSGITKLAKMRSCHATSAPCRSRHARNSSAIRASRTRKVWPSSVASPAAPRRRRGTSTTAAITLSVICGRPTRRAMASTSRAWLKRAPLSEEKRARRGERLACASLASGVSQDSSFYSPYFLGVTSRHSFHVRPLPLTRMDFGRPEDNLPACSGAEAVPGGTTTAPTREPGQFVFVFICFLF